MRSPSTVLAVLVLVVELTGSSLASPFVLFPKAGELHSPDGRYVVRNAERTAPTTEFVGISHSLWLIDVATQRSRKLCDYLGVVAVAWSGNDYVVMTEYVAKKTSRARVFPVAEFGEAVVLDKTTLFHALPAESRDRLEESDHVFVEASHLEGGILFLHVWGNGPHDREGFRWACAYALREGTLHCTEHLPTW
ncbi:MAG TPA: hypothetical protein VK466_07770 [Terriglobales bacterium]|nr:hypothetical protein [Terriglobales bacterium]